MEQRVADKNVDQSEKGMEIITQEAIQSIAPEDWKKECNHVDCLRYKFQHDDQLYELEEREIISLGGEGSGRVLKYFLILDIVFFPTTRTFLLHRFFLLPLQFT